MSGKWKWLSLTAVVAVAVGIIALLAVGPRSSEDSSPAPLASPSDSLTPNSPQQSGAPTPSGQDSPTQPGASSGPPNVQPSAQPSSSSSESSSPSSSSTSSSREREVPDVSGMPVWRAVLTLQEAGLRPTSLGFAGQGNPGQVLFTYPNAGVLAQTGDPVELLVPSSTPKKVAGLAGMPVMDAIDKILQSGSFLGVLEAVPGPQPGVVVSAYPEGKPVPLEYVPLLVTAGPLPYKFPDLAGMDTNLAVYLLQQYGLVPSSGTDQGFKSTVTVSPDVTGALFGDTVVLQTQ